MPHTSPTFWETFVFWLTLCAAWMTGESGRVIVAGGFGGVLRWLSSDKRRIRTGIAAIVGGAIVGRYAWPGVLGVVHMPETPNNVAMAAFIAGTMGVSLVKIMAAMVESRAEKLTGGTDD